MGNLNQRRVTRRELVIDDYHGVKVADPYRWLEDDASPETQQWMSEQNSDFEGYISGFNVRKELKSRLTELWSYAKTSPPHLVEGSYYIWRNDGLQNQSILYRLNDLDDYGEIVFDPNTLSKDGTVAVSTRAFSPKGNYLAYGLSSSGSDWQTIKVLDLNTKQNIPDVLYHIKFSGISWLPDESGFFYTRYPDPKTTVLASRPRNPKVYLHMLGQEQNEDKLIYQDGEHPDWSCYVHTDYEKNWAFLSVRYGTLFRNQLYYKSLSKLDTDWLPIASDFEEGYQVVGVIDGTAYIFTQKDAPYGKVMSLKLSENGASDWQTVIGDQGELLDSVQIVNNQLLCVFLHHATHRIKLYELNGAFVRDIELPALGSVGDITAKQDGKEFFINFSSYLYPGTIMRYDFSTEKLNVWFSPEINFPFEDYETVQEFYASKDGTRVPMFITRRKGLVKDGSNPAVLYGYGGFNISMKPSLSIAALAWLEKGGIYAQACIRGGDEYGEAWHRGGMLESKQNVFDDFIAAGEYLISEKYTSKERLGIVGGSNGGLLTGACVTQRPDLYGAVVVMVPVLDMLRYHCFTSGHNWIGEYGCADDPEQFSFLYKYSPLHNVKMNTVYPPTLVMTADTDDRVVPCQARKFTATLQSADGGENPILIRIEKSAGHGMGKPVSKVIDNQTDLYTFFFANLCKA